MTWLKATLGTALIVAALPEAAHALSSRLAYGATPEGANPPASEAAAAQTSIEGSTRPTEAIIVLGCPTHPDGTLHPLQRWRVDIAARTLNPAVQKVVFTGTTAKTGISEAAAMAAYAQTRGIPASLIVLEEEALSTWQNLQFTAPIVEPYDIVRLVSDPMHAWRARQYLRRQNPELAAKLQPAVDYRPLERWRWKLGTMVYELVARYREWRTPRLPR